MAAEPNAQAEDIPHRIVELERRVRRLQCSTVILAVLVAWLLAIDRHWGKVVEGAAAIAVLVFALTIVPLIVFGGMKLLDRWSTKN